MTGEKAFKASRPGNCMVAKTATTPDPPVHVLTKKAFIGYAVGFVGPVSLLSIVNMMLNLYYIYVIGLDPFLAGAGLSIGLITYSVFALIWGNVSDNHSGKLAKKYGKRKPFLFGALVPIVVTYILMWFPPERPTTLGETNWPVTIWLWVTSGLFHLAFSCFSSSYWSLMPEISHDEEERLRLSMSQQMANLVGNVVSLLLPIILLAGSDWDESLFWAAGTSPTAGERIINLMGIFGFVFAILTVMTVLMTVFLVDEPPIPENPPPAPSMREFFKNLFKPLKDNPDFAYWQVSNALTNVAGRMLLLDIFIFVRVVLKLDGIEWAIMFVVLLASGGGSFVGFDKLKKKIGLKRTFQYGLLLGAVVMLLAAFFLVELSEAASFAWGLVFLVFGIMAVIGILIFPTPINAALVDKGAALNGVPRTELSGKYYGLFLFFLYSSSALASLLYSAVLDALGAENLVAIVLILPISGLFLLAAWLVYLKVDLTVPGTTPQSNATSGDAPAAAGTPSKTNTPGQSAAPTKTAGDSSPSASEA